MGIELYSNSLHTVNLYNYILYIYINPLITSNKWYLFYPLLHGPFCDSETFNVCERIHRVESVLLNGVRAVVLHISRKMLI